VAHPPRWAVKDFLRRVGLPYSSLTGSAGRAERAANRGMALPTTMKYIQTAAFGVPEYEIKSQPRWGRSRIYPLHYQRLWWLARGTGKTVTQLVAEALHDYVANLDRERS
jgi:hypothetical protein